MKQGRTRWMERGLAGMALVALAGCQGTRVARLAAGPAERWHVSSDGVEAAETGWKGPYAFKGMRSMVEIDLGRQAMIGGVVLEWAEGAVPAGYRIWTSGDGKEWRTAASLESDGGLDYAAWGGTVARRIRVGAVRPATSGTVPKLVRFAVLDRTCPAEVQCGGMAQPEGLAWLDGDVSTEWTAPGVEALVDLGRTLTLGSVRLTWGDGGEGESVDVALSKDGERWTELGTAERHGESGYDVAMGENTTSARWIRLRATAGAEKGLRLAEVTVRGTEGVGAAWTAYSTVAQRAGDARYPGTARGTAAAWTRVAGIGGKGAEGLMNTEGGVAAGRHSPGLWAVVELADGRVLWPETAAERELGCGAPGAPMPEGRWRWPEAGVELRIRGMSRDGESGKDGGVAFRYDVTATGEGRVEGKLSWLVRPVQIPGEEAGGGLAPIARIRQTVSDGRQDLRVNSGAAAWSAAGGGLEFEATAFEGGDIGRWMGSAGKGPGRGIRGGKKKETEEEGGGTGSTAEVRDAKGLASGKWSMGFSLGAGESAGRVLRGTAGGKRGSQPKTGCGAEEALEAFEREWNEQAWSWKRLLEPGSATTEGGAGILPLVAAQWGWLAAEGPGRADAAEGGSDEEWTWRTSALLRSGQTDAGRACLERMLEERAEGEASAEGAGMFAFLMMEGWRFGRDAGLLQKAYPEMRRGMEAVDRACHAKKKRSKWRPWSSEEGDGLLPPGADGRRLYADNYWALLGWKEIRAAAAALGKDDDTVWADGKYRELKRTLKESLAAATRGDSRLPTGLDGRRDDAMRSAADAALLVWPCGEIDMAGESVVASSLDAAYREFLRRRRGGGEVRGDEARLWSALARTGRAAEAHEWMFEWSALAGRDGWGALPAGWMLDRRGQARADGWRPNLLTASLYALAVRQMAVAEDGEQLRLLEGVPPEFLRGAGLTASDVPTAFGSLDLTARRSRLGFRAEIGGRVRPPGGYRLSWPEGETPIRVDLNGRTMPEGLWNEDGIRLPDDFKGTVSARFEGAMEDLRERKEMPANR